MFTASDIEYYLFNSMFFTRDIRSPQAFQSGLQFIMVDGQHVVRGVWDGYPGDRSGLRRGDVILEAASRARREEGRLCAPLVVHERCHRRRALTDRPGVVLLDRRLNPVVSSPGEIEPHPWFKGPMVVIIDEGTRSGKEALAFQFKESRRAKLIGITTAGAFSGGNIILNDQQAGFMLYLAVQGLILDGRQLEGVGVAPDTVVEYPSTAP